MALLLSAKSESPKPLQMVTSNMPSSGLALGQTHMPPPKYWQLPTATQVIDRSSACPSSAEKRIFLSLYLSRALTEASLNESVPPSALEVWLTSSTTTPEMPHEAMLMK